MLFRTLLILSFVIASPAFSDDGLIGFFDSSLEAQRSGEAASTFLCFPGDRDRLSGSGRIAAIQPFRPCAGLRCVRLAGANRAKPHRPLGGGSVLGGGFDCCPRRSARQPGAADLNSASFFLCQLRPEAQHQEDKSGRDADSDQVCQKEQQRP